MELAADIECPWCGAVCSLAVDTAEPEQALVTDCEVCCRPFEVRVRCEPGEILGLDVRSG